VGATAASRRIYFVTGTCIGRKADGVALILRFRLLPKRLASALLFKWYWRYGGGDIGGGCWGGGSGK